MIGLPLLAAGGGSSAYYLRLHRQANREALADIRAAPAPARGQRLLVLSPHCDDETLGVGQLIADSRRAGAAVTVAFLTNGDGFHFAASRTLREVSVSPRDYVRFAEVRQRESISALGELGVPADNVAFLGYPDRGLKPMWEQYWSPDNPFRSAFTGQTICPYPHAFAPHSLYCGSQLLRDVVRLYEQTRPTDIYVTHPSDDHPDHSAAAAYAEAALRLCQARPADDAWSHAASLHFYLVHRGDWPLPQGLHPTLPLVPPVALSHLDTAWTAFTGSPADALAKRNALDRYESQMSVEGRFLTSFLRVNELFGSLPDGQPPTSAAAPLPGAVPRSGAASDAPWAIALDPAGDDFMRYATPSADLTGILLRPLAGGKEIEVRVETRGPVSRRIHYELLMRGMSASLTGTGVDIDPSMASRFQPLTLTPSPNDIRTHARFLRAVVSLSTLGLDDPRLHDRCLWLCAETRLSDRLPALDRTGYRLFALADPPTPAIASAFDSALQPAPAR